MSILDPKALHEAISHEVGTKAIQKPVEFVINGKEIKGLVYVKALSYEAVSEVDNAFKWKPIEDEPGMMELESIDDHHLRAAQILGTICTDENGTPYFSSIEQVKSYPAPACKAFWSVANDVNVFLGKLMTTNSQKTNSGQSLSSTESLEEPLLKPKPTRTSATANTSSGESIGVEEEPLTSD